MLEEDNILKKKASWVVYEKMEIKNTDIVKESSVEFFPDRFAVHALLLSGSKKKAVVKSQKLAMEILSVLSSIK